MITKNEIPDSGNFAVGDTVKLGYVDQSRDDLDPNKNVWEEISEGNDILKLGRIEMQSRAYVSAFNFRGPNQQKKVGQLSGGERNRVHLAKMLKSGANVLLLDEPTNDLDTETLSALEEALERFPGCAVIISHDRSFLDRWPLISSLLKAIRKLSGLKAIMRTMKPIETGGWGQDSDTPQRIKYKPLRKAG